MFHIEKPRMTAKRVFGGAPETILDHIRMLDPTDPNKETEDSPETGTILDHYVPIGEPKEDPNEKCYWDKKVIKEKRELEQSAARMQARSREQSRAWGAAAVAEQAAISAARRGNTPGEGLGYYALFK